MEERKIKKMLDEIEGLGYIVKRNKDVVEIVEIYKSIISNRIIQKEVAMTTDITIDTSEKWLEEVLEDLKEI